MSSRQLVILFCILLESISPLNIRDFILCVGSRVFESSWNGSTTACVVVIVASGLRVHRIALGVTGY